MFLVCDYAKLAYETNFVGMKAGRGMHVKQGDKADRNKRVYHGI